MLFSPVSTGRALKDLKQSAQDIHPRSTIPLQCLLVPAATHHSNVLVSGHSFDPITARIRNVPICKHVLYTFNKLQYSDSAITRTNFASKLDGPQSCPGVTTPYAIFSDKQTGSFRQFEQLRTRWLHCGNV